MARCKICGKKGLFLFLSENGLCSNCEKFFINDISNSTRIINDCIKIIDTSKNFDTRLSRCNILQRELTKLLEYQKKDINLTKFISSNISLSELYSLCKTTREEILKEKAEFEELKKICPYCKKQLEKIVKRSKKCPHCGNQIKVKSGKLYTVKEFDKLKEAEKERRIKEITEYNRANLQKYKESGIVKYVEILSAGDSCENCKKWTNKKIPIDKAIKENILPVKNCTDERGCRCCYIPVIED